MYGPVELGFLCGSVPTIAMLAVSIMLYHTSFGEVVEACIQNFTAGLILAIVATELFPLMVDGAQADVWVGVTVGFFLSFLLLNGIETTIEYISAFKFSIATPQTLNIDNIAYEVTRNMNDMSYDVEMAAPRTHSDTPNPEFKKTKVRDDRGEELEDIDHGDAEHTWEEEGLIHAVSALSLPNHRSHIKEHIQELIDLVNSMETKSNRLLENEQLPQEEVETIAEQIDEQVHSLQYKVDHCRRLLQGSEVRDESGNTVAIRPSWVTDDKKLAMKKRLIALRCTSQHLFDHMQELDNMGGGDTPLIEEIHDHMRDMDTYIGQFHEYVDTWTWKWKRRTVLSDPEVGDKLPLSLIIPVTIDCFVDGFLIGVSVGLSPKAGYILAGANSLEMSSLGMAYSARLAKCTGSTFLARQLAMICPPLLMFLSSGFGAFLANQAQDSPVVFICFVAFGVYALIALVCCELILEARDIQNERDLWWLQFFIFIGVYTVIMLEPVL